MAEENLSSDAWKIALVHPVISCVILLKRITGRWNAPQSGMKQVMAPIAPQAATKSLMVVLATAT